MSESARKYRLSLSYDGTQFCGWQVQSNADTVQGRLESILKLLTKDSVRLIGSGRTDAGVHAKGQVAHFMAAADLDIQRTLRSMNGMLPPDIRVLNLTRAHPDFHAQYSAEGKVYHYHLHLGAVADPFTRLYSLHCHQDLCLERLRQALACFVGTHDFTSFANAAHEGSAAKNPVRSIYRIDLIRSGPAVRIEFEGSGFLYKMVRNIVGTALDVAMGKRELESIPEIFAAKDRKKASRSAPAHGLFLMEVHYPKDLMRPHN
jgi:tRNA pseudouridine38-40 synthase